MIAVDTNILVYAHRPESVFHVAACESLEALRSGREGWALPWSVVHEFVGVVTNPRIFKTPSPVSIAFLAIDALAAGENLHFLSESEGYRERLSSLCNAAKIEGPRIHDARIAALCLHHGVSVLWTADRDFSLFPDLKVKNPLINSGRT